MESDLDIELTDDEIAIIKLGLFSFTGLLIDILREEGQAKLDELIGELKGQVKLEEGADLIQLSISALRKFEDEEEAQNDFEGEVRALLEETA
jgi:hypothetical protein